MFVRTVQFAVSYFNRDVEIVESFVSAVTSGSVEGFINFAFTLALMTVLLVVRCDFDLRALTA